MVLYFAYGSNLSSRQMQARCAGAVAAGPAALTGYALAFTRPSKRWGGHAGDIVPAPGGETWGVLWRLDEHHLAALDRFEGVPSGAYLRTGVEVAGSGGALFNAQTYRVVDPKPGGGPSARYLHVILEGAREHALPAHWLNHLASFGRGVGDPAAVR